MFRMLDRAPETCGTRTPAGPAHAAEFEPSDADRPRFGSLLRRHRLAAGLTQAELAERARMSANGIGALERGDRRIPHRQTVRFLAEALELGDEERQAFVQSGIRGASQNHFRGGEWAVTSTIERAARLEGPAAAAEVMRALEAAIARKRETHERCDRFVVFVFDNGEASIAHAASIVTALRDSRLAVRIVALNGDG